MKNEEYSVKLVASIEKIVSGESATRGKIYDRNYNLLVDNEVVDTETIITSFVGDAPYYDPKFSIVVISPDVAEAGTDTTSSINKRLSSSLVNKYFELYG